MVERFVGGRTKKERGGEDHEMGREGDERESNSSRLVSAFQIK